MKKIYSLLLICIAAVASYAVAEETGVLDAIKLTLRDGTVKHFKLDDIEDITFGSSADIPDEPPVGPVTPPDKEFTSAPYAVGDFYFDGETEGIVVSVDATGSYGKVMSMTDNAPSIWSSADDITGAQDEDNGQVNFETVRGIDPDFEAYPAFKACAELGEGWYLPSQKEMQGVRSNLDVINATLKLWGKPEISTDALYWSSTECEQFSDAMAYCADMGMPGMFGIQKTLPNPSRGFKEFGEVPQARYKVGELCEEEGMKGVIFWVSRDGSYAQIMSLTAAEGQWGAVGSDVGASDNANGEANMTAVSQADASLAGYEAFKLCADLGGAWYLPSLKELVSIAKMRGALNVKMQTIDGATTLTTGYYWSSTQVGSDPANSAYCVYMTDLATQMPSSKNVSRKVRAIAIVGDRPAADVIYAVGDPYVENDEVVGIVTAVTDGGRHGRVLALKNVQEPGRVNNAMWVKRSEYEYTVMGCDSRTDGAANLAAMRAVDPELVSFPAQLACVALGDGWYMPAIDELADIYPILADINAALKANGGSALDTSREYWSSTEGTVERAASFNFKNGEEFNYRRYMYLCVRPMKAF